MRRRDFLSLGCAAALTHFGGCAKRKSRWQAAITTLEERIPRLMEEFHVPGLSLALIEDAQVIWHRPFGFKDSAARTLVDDGIIFEAASMSKPVFAYAVLKLCERGVMNLDTPLTRYTSERPLKDDPRLDLITARHILSHTGGFQNWREEDHKPLSIHFTPGEKWMYSGEGYAYLLSVVTHLTGMSFEDYMQKNILDPFGMNSSGYVWNDMMERRAARPHDAQGVPMNNKKSTHDSVARYGSAGALQTTPTDYARFQLEILAPKPQDNFRLGSGSLKEMVRPQIKTGDPADSSWSLGWNIVTKPDGNIVNHGGDNDGFHCWNLMSLERKSGFVIMNNGDGGSPMLIKLITGDELTPLL